MRRGLIPIVDVAGTIAIALALLGAFFTLSSGNAGFGFPEGVRVLANFMDVGLAVWIVLLIVFTVRGSLTARRAYLGLAIGAVLNLLVVITVGLIQTGGWAGELILFAVEAGIACLLAAAAVVPLVHRVRRHEA